MFKNLENAKNLRCHVMDRKVNGIMRHPVDTPSWRLIDHMWPTFGSEARNLRLVSKVLRLVQYVEKRLLQLDYNMEKNVYMGHKKYLPRHHPYRLQKKNFDGKQEHGNPPQPLSGDAIYFKLKEMIFSCGKKCGKIITKVAMTIGKEDQTYSNYHIGRTCMYDIVRT
ncbi:hypothetical protein E6C27_scaffold57G002460 [Cucumis melo var. makuwa]|uniref:Transposase n=1 Tax=Cucumis melo var. makuwa TaxID=1194695 RepID=A0A5A7SV59_CUCMM|nr:hypothetical protein E6C27_scaffold57G002460 [Cucumis melo var. makuwa]